MKQKLKKLTEEINVQLWLEILTLPSIANTDKIRWTKISKGRENMNYTIHQLNLTCLYETPTHHSGWYSVPPKIHVHLEPQNVNLLGIRASADVIKIRILR